MRLWHLDFSKYGKVAPLYTVPCIEGNLVIVSVAPRLFLVYSMEGNLVIDQVAPPLHLSIYMHTLNLFLFHLAYTRNYTQSRNLSPAIFKTRTRPISNPQNSPKTSSIFVFETRFEILLSRASITYLSFNDPP